jgi:hypothetical protein
MKYRVILRCSKKADADKFDRMLEMNSWEGAEATFKTLVIGALEDLIDPYVIEYYYGDELHYKLEKL